MRWCLLFAVILGLSITDAVSHAQQRGRQGQGEAERLTRQRPGSEHLEHSSAGYFAKSGVVRFRLIQGRLQLDAPRHRKGSQSFDQNGVYESITVTAQRGIPSVHYVYQTPHQHLTLSVANATDVRVESFLPQTGQRAVLQQPSVGKITWTTKHGELETEVQGDTLLHIYQADSFGFDSHCDALTTRLLRGQSISDVEFATKQAMLEQIAEGDFVVVNCEDVLDCVQRLGASRRSIRVAASKELLQWGTPILPLIRSIDASHLSVEQHDRLNATMTRLKRIETDTPASLAALLRNDQQHWQSIAGGLSMRQTQLANRYLSSVGLGELPPTHGAIEQIASGENFVR